MHTVWWYFLSALFGVVSYITLSPLGWVSSFMIAGVLLAALTMARKQHMSDWFAVGIGAVALVGSVECIFTSDDPARFWVSVGAIVLLMIETTRVLSIRHANKRRY